MQAFTFKFSQTIRPIFVFMSLLLLIPTSCEKEDDIATRNYPRLITLAASEISQTSAKFEAQIISGNPSEIVEYGFTWSDINSSPTLQNSANVDIIEPVSGILKQ